MPSGVKIFVCEQGNPQGYRVYVDNYEQYEKALNKFTYSDLYIEESK